METAGRAILVVDDSIEFSRLAAKLLEIHGYQVTVANEGRKALECVDSHCPDLVILDLNLPDINGMEVLKRIKERNEDTAVVVITGYGGEKSAVEMMKAGALDFLSKPVDNAVLLGAIRNALKMRDAQVEDRKLQRYSPLEKFFPFFAHEIRNPLHAIGGALAIIERRSDTKDEILAQSIRIIQEEVQHLNEFVQECLGFVRPPTKSHFSEIDIHEVVSIVISIASHMFEGLSKKIKVTTDFGRSFPKVEVNYEEIKQALLNIVKNSFEAMGEGGELIIKTLYRPDPVPGWIEIVFADTGPGIKEENLKYLFTPFFTTKLRGTGLGLAICHRIVTERHRGNIHIESEKGKGTTVVLKLPVRPPVDIA